MNLFLRLHLVGGRVVAIVFDEWSFYREHPELMPAFWLGGMATHGLLVGATVSTGLYALVWNRPFLVLADALVIPGAFLMGVGRVGNFIDGQIVGSITDVWWAVEFPYAEGFRHPAVLYDGAKNARSRSRRLGRLSSVAVGSTACERARDAAPHWAQRITFAALLLFCLMIPSNWTQNIASRYGWRHAGLMQSFLYPPIDWAPPPASR